MKINKLIRKNILNLNAYKSARKIGGKGDIWLNANEYPKNRNYFLECNNLNRYPEFQPNNIISNYAKYVKLDSNQILVCRGSDEGIDILIKAFCDPEKDSILFFPPTYGMYKISAEILNINCITIITDHNWQLNLSKIKLKLLSYNIKIIFICNPNNPTGNLINIKDILYLIELTDNRSLIVIDEAYIDFCIEYSLSKLLLKYKNLIILRTLSKAFALAGIRCGFILSNPKIIDILLKIIAPYPIPKPVSNIAAQALNKKNILKIKKRVLMIKKNRIFLEGKLKNIDCVYKIFPSVSNYLLVQFHARFNIFKNLWDQGIILRDQSESTKLDNCIRITVGTIKECNILIDSITKIMSFY